MDLKLLKMRCKDSKQHHVIFHELLIQLVRCYVLLKMFASKSHTKSYILKRHF